jgi:5-methylcytosine-specific restriction enzyme subunit McrC
VRRCLSLSECLRRIGVDGERPSRSEVSAERFGRHDAIDQQMVALAHLAFDLRLPTEFLGNRNLADPERTSHWVRKLFEKAVAGFYAINLAEHGWYVHPGKRIKWPIEKATTGIEAILPSMKTDIVLDHHASGRRIVIDTKFTSILKKGQYREKTLSSGYMYQLYAYLRSQEDGGDWLAARASGLLLYPAVDEIIDETAVIQGHSIRFATVNLGATANEIRAQLLQMVKFPLNSDFDAAQPTVAAEEN